MAAWNAEADQERFDGFTNFLFDWFHGPGGPTCDKLDNDMCAGKFFPAAIRRVVRKYSSNSARRKSQLWREGSKRPGSQPSGKSEILWGNTHKSVGIAIIVNIVHRRQTGLD